MGGCVLAHELRLGIATSGLHLSGSLLPRVVNILAPQLEGGRGPRESKMSLFDYRTSIEISAKDYPFYALIMAAMRQADTDNLEKLSRAFPEIYQELLERYNRPGGILPSEVESFLDNAIRP